MEISLIGTIASIITAIVAIFGIYPVVKGLIQADKNLRFLIYKEIFDMFEEHREEKEEFDKMILSNKDFNIMDLSEDKREKYYKLARLYDRWGQLILHGVFPIEFILDFYSRPIKLTWEKMYPYIILLRQKRDQPGHMAKFEFLAYEANQYRKKIYSESYPFQKPKTLLKKYLWERYKAVRKPDSK